jgi:hypothetical protein
VPDTDDDVLITYKIEKLRGNQLKAALKKYAAEGWVVVSHTFLGENDMYSVIFMLKEEMEWL